jgi:glycogen debranching enzyme
MYKYIRTKYIKLNGKKCDKADFLNEGDVLTLYIKDEFFENNKEKIYEFLKAPVKLDLVYEDENIMLIDKKPGVIVHQDKSYHFDSLIMRVQHYLYKKGEYDPEKEKSVVRVVKERLYVGVGLRSLDVDDEQYHGIYQGALEKRDHAYHQGTAWGFLLGAFIEAYLKTGGHTAQAIEEAKAMFAPVEKHLFEGCIGTISEIFDGDEPHTARGCYAQAWSVGEVLRAYALLLK